MVKRLGYGEFEALYKQRIVADFPRAERRPLSVIHRLYARGRYLCLTLEEQGQTAAYAGFVCDDAVGGVLLDYFAVDRARRGGGVGSRFLAVLRDYWPEKDGILVECEAPNRARTAAERLERERRIAFYLRGGAQASDVVWRVFGVEYNLLWLPIRRRVQEVDLSGTLLALYKFSMPRFLVPLFLKRMSLPEAKN